nr:hypothetical protein [Tanacetum cinerariifolium]
MALVLMAKAFKLNYTTPTNNNQRISSNPHNRQIAQSGIVNHNRDGNVVAIQARGNGNGNNANQIMCYNYKGVGHNARNCTQASTSGTHDDKALVYDSGGSAE